MKVSKLALLVGSIICSVILIYGAALIMKGIKGSFLFANGLFDLSYFILLLVVAVPIALYILIAGDKKYALSVVFYTILFLFILYIPIYSVIVSAKSTIFIAAVLGMVVVLTGSSHMAVYHHKKNN
ncbi:hypothetical protein MUB24_11165 [Lederbergia sp. NSJ-179]|uniref:hypothetical protein n=1 Tax=Lederbergia sp. NSJ-179 TaxID=2931402 RepID=UPI001FD271BA|nr:hypothetical protein [Lederbergia sp. NSJ-179]MCJ7841444.1 hypothetical protein [Lederbergia sp. NSJ-179]